MHYRKQLATCTTAAAIAVLGACGGNDCPAPIPDPALPQPPVVNSANGVLNARLECVIAPNTLPDPSTGALMTIQTPTYNGALTGPTLRVKPGDRLEIEMVNSFPANPGVQRTGMSSFPHDPFTTNLHTHGLTVCPNGISDNVFRLMPPQGDPDFAATYPVSIDIAPNHQSGTFWYHPHKHGSVSFQFFGGMSGMLIVEGGEGTLDTVPEVAAAEDVVMNLQVIRTDASGSVPFVDQLADAFSTKTGGSSPDTIGVWNFFNDSNFWFIVNGLFQPTLKMQPGEVQRWRILNAASGETLALALEGHTLNVIANDGITVPEMVPLGSEVPYVVGSGGRVDVLVQAGEPGTYLLQAVNPTPDEGLPITYGTTVNGDPIAVSKRFAQVGGDFPSVTYPVTLARVVVEGDPIDPPMGLPSGPLPQPVALPTIEQMQAAMTAADRNVAWEICGPRQADDARLESCGWYYSVYNDEYWGGPFGNLLMMRDADDSGEPNMDKMTQAEMPRINYTTEGLFTPGEPLFQILGGTFEEWTLDNRTFSDHPFHIHINPFLLTHVNGEELAVPQWHDVMLTPRAVPGNMSNPPNINRATFGSITFRNWFNPRTTGCTVIHCHITSHEDVGMMQEIEVLNADGSSNCDDCIVPPIPPNDN